MSRLATWTILLALSQTASSGPLRDAIEAHRGERQAERGRNTTSAQSLPQGARLLRDVAYGADPKQRMDVYLPARAKNAPVIFMAHGGGWRIGDKAMSRVIQNKVQRWVARGFVFISVNYRLLPQADPLQQASDVAQALAKAQAQAVGWGADPNRFILMGHSAGAHLVDLLTANPGLALKMGARRWLGTVSLDTAAMDIVQTMQGKHPRLYDRAFGQDAAYWQAASPLHQLAKTATPMLLVCSSQRTDAPCTQARQFAEHARPLGVRVEVLPQAMTHGAINSDLGLPGAYTEAVETFMASLDPRIGQMLKPGESR
ncbi:Acetyl esterase/lipase [Formivibrio citricus]|uniref:Acetyl esterase/lipase n=1 Tax=Formivibrio citricus TaxID=83765 RepID=A0A1I5A4N7_9NEIS|nr:alpha/beta hydrolase [Formivibrio citricus]SFN57209.1 Acetyl esterase/lipase [Formivibrio citricus]